MFEPKVRWLGLGVKRHTVTGEDIAEMAFVARSKFTGRAYRLHEASPFMLDHGRWR